MSNPNPPITDTESARRMRQAWTSESVAKMKDTKIRNRLIKQIAIERLSEPLENSKYRREAINFYGSTEALENKTVKDFLVDKQIERAIDDETSKGYETLQAAIGEKPIDKIENSYAITEETGNMLMSLADKILGQKKDVVITAENIKHTISEISRE